ncbi:hypothetical protein BDB01DRAFT_314040 [Pilobolus umbonatus]|nr:hypothetical protein BDB01DRAFT_314040 [Pilobolus umbonatus]
MVIRKKQAPTHSDSESELEEYEHNYSSNSVNTDEESEVEESEEEVEDKKAQVAKLKRGLAHVSFEQLSELKNKLGEEELRSKYDKVKKGKSGISKEQILKDLKGAAKKIKKTNKVKLTKDDMKRESKHRPMEISSKRAVTRHRAVVELPAEKRRDPRFDKLSGQLNQDLFEKSYSFLNDYKKTEMDMLKERLRKENDPEAREELKSLLLKKTSAERTEQEKKRRQELLRERKKREAELVKEGKTPYFLKKSEKRKLELMDRYKQMGEKTVDRILEKRRKRNTTKDRKGLPFKRRSAE